MLALLLAVAGGGFFGLQTMNLAMNDIVHDRVPKVTRGLDWEVSVLQSARHMRNILILEGQEAVNKELASLG